MTNGEKFLKDGISAREFREKLAQFIFYELGLYAGTEEAIDEVIGDFLDMIEKPTLTEDERVILRNIKDKPRYIAREKDYRLMAYDKVEKDGTSRSYENGKEMSSFSHLFQFIKNGEEYSIEELLKGE